MNDTFIFNKLKDRSVRWLRNNFFDGELIEPSKFSVRELIENNTIREKVLESYVNGLSDVKKMLLSRRLWLYPEEKQKIVLFFVQPNEPLCQKFRNNIIDQISNFEVIKEMYLSQKAEIITVYIEQSIPIVNSADDISALFYFCENVKFNFDEIKITMAFVVGRVGRKNTKIICDCQDANIKMFANILGVDCASSEELGINLKETK